MDISLAIILGLIQGLTEFLPISSSGHLVIVETLLGYQTPGVSLEVWLHFGTLLAVLVYFRRRIYEIIISIFVPHRTKADQNRTMLFALVIGTVPAVIVGLLFKSSIESAFKSPVLASIMLIVTGMILLLSYLAKDKRVDIKSGHGILIGLAQAVAILPGISRSGSTIVTAMLIGISPARAAEFSFLLAIPAIGGAFVLDLYSTGGSAMFSGDLLIYLVGTATSFVVGYLSIHFLLGIINKGKFFYFGFYCLVAGAASLIYLSV